MSALPIGKFAGIALGAGGQRGLGRGFLWMTPGPGTRTRSCPVAFRVGAAGLTAERPFDRRQDLPRRQRARLGAGSASAGQTSPLLAQVQTFQDSPRWRFPTTHPHCLRAAYERGNRCRIDAGEIGRHAGSLTAAATRRRTANGGIVRRGARRPIGGHSCEDVYASRPKLTITKGPRLAHRMHGIRTRSR